MQQEHTKINETAWNQLAYEAWTNRFGTPFDAAADIKKDPAKKLGTLHRYFGDVKDKKIVNLLGSHGIKGVALALLEADITVIDFSSDNKRYAEELSKAANVTINYILSDVLNVPEEENANNFDIAFCELGILHYFTDLKLFFRTASNMLKPEGIFIIQDFHPISTKLITTKGKKHKVTGDYFSKELTETEVAYLKYIPGIEALTEAEKNGFQKALIRKWTIGEIITFLAESGFTILELNESEGPKPEDKGIPKLFTVKAKKSI